MTGKYRLRAAMLDNWLFAARHDWRCWQGQRFKYLVLIAGFALVCGLLALSLRLGQLLLHEPPAWAAADQHYLTLVQEDKSGRLVGRSSLAEIESLRERPQVHAAAALRFDALDVEHADGVLPSMQTVWFDELFPRFVNFSWPGREQGESRQQVWLSERAYRKHFDADPRWLGRSLRVSKLPHALTIAGVLPAAMNRLGSMQPDLWIDAWNQRYFLPFKAPDPGHPDPKMEKQIRMMLATMPVYYGVLQTDAALNARTLTRQLRASERSYLQSDSGGSRIRIVDSGLQPVVLPGINFSPDEYSALRAQWLALLALVILMSLMLAVNALTIFSAHWISRWHEINIQRILGAGPSAFLHMVVAGLLPSAALLVLVSGLVTAGLASLVERAGVYRQWAGEQALGLSVSNWLLAVALVLVLLLLCRAMPLLLLLRNVRFTRAMGASQGKLQRGFDMLAGVLQSACTVLVLGLVGALMLGEWQLQRTSVMDESVVEIQLTAEQPAALPAELAAGQLPGASGLEVAAASTSVIGPGVNAEFSLSGLEQPLPVPGWRVSANFFDFLGLAVEGEAEAIGEGVVINRALADYLHEQLPGQKLFGLVPQLGLFHTARPIVGIVDNLPHQGRASQDKFAIYVPLLDGLDLPILALLGREASRDSFVQAVHSWADRALSHPQAGEPQSLAAQLREHDRTRHDLLRFSFALAVLIIAVAFIGLIYQIKARLLLRQHEYGVYAAVGAPPARLLLFAIREGLVTLVLAMPVALAAHLFVLRFVDAGLSLFHPLMIPLSFVLVVLMIMLAALQPLQALRRRSIAGILRTS